MTVHVLPVAAEGARRHEAPLCQGPLAVQTVLAWHKEVPGVPDEWPIVGPGTLKDARRT